MAYITPNDRKFAEFVERDVSEWNGRSVVGYVNDMHMPNGEHSETYAMDAASVIDDRVCDWMERGNSMPSVTMIVRMREWMR